MFRFGFFDEPEEPKKKKRNIKVSTEVLLLNDQILSPEDPLVQDYRINDKIVLKKRKFNDSKSLAKEINSTELKDAVKNVDVETDVYEGGFKIWECTLDLCQYIVKTYEKQIVGKRVLELGCGHGLPGILALRLGCEHVVFQDLNIDVLKVITACNIGLNDLLPESVNLIAGDWGCPILQKQILEIQKQTDKSNKLKRKKHVEEKEKIPIIEKEENKFYFIISSETIYREEAYDSFVQLIENSLHSEGIALIAAKRFYFGVGGSVQTFKTHVENNSRLSIEVVHSIDDGKSNIRDILSLVWRKEETEAEN